MSRVTGGLRAALSFAWRRIGVIAAGVVFVYCVIRAFDPPRLNWGDSNTDYNVMIAGRNFANHGFLNLRLTPNLLDRSVMTSADSGMIYTHYPQLADLVNGALRATFGMTDLVQFRLVALAVSFAGLFFVYGLVRRYWSRQTAEIAIALWVTNPLWIQHADYLHHGPYGAFFSFGSAYFLARSFGDRHHRWLLAASGAFLFLAYLSSYNYWIFTPLILAAITVGHYRDVFAKPVARTLGLLAAFAALAICCKVATNIWALNGFSAFLTDLRGQYLLRATSVGAATDYRGGVWPILEGRVERFFTIALFPVTAFWVLFPVIHRRWGDAVAALRRIGANPVLILLAALPFPLIFSEMFVDQYYPTLLLLPYYAIACASIIMLLDAGSGATRVAAKVFFAALLANSFYETASFKSAFFDEHAIRSLRIQLDARLPRGQPVLVNNVLDAAYRYYFDRQVVYLLGVQSHRMSEAIAHFSDPTVPPFRSPNGILLVQQKHLSEEMYDKNYFYLLAHYRLWDALARPREHRRDIEAIIADRNRAISEAAARVGTKVYETDFYTLWQIPPSASEPPMQGSIARK